MVNKKASAFCFNFPAKNCRGWIKIIEAFFAILLIMSVLLVVINQNYKIKEIPTGIYDRELEMLKEIQLNESLRVDILNSTPPVEWADFESAGLNNLKVRIENSTPSYLECGAKICSISNECNINSNVSKSIYVSSARMFANLNMYSPKELKLFCWNKE